MLSHLLCLGLLGQASGDRYQASSTMGSRSVDSRLDPDLGMEISVAVAFPGSSSPKVVSEPRPGQPWGCFLVAKISFRHTPPHTFLSLCRIICHTSVTDPGHTDTPHSYINLTHPPYLTELTEHTQTSPRVLGAPTSPTPFHLHCTPHMGFQGPMMPHT